MIPNDVVDLLRRTIEILTPTTVVIFNWVDAPRPATDYAMLGINTMIQVGFGETKDFQNGSGDLDRRFQTLFNITIGVDFFRQDAMLGAALLSGGLISNEIVELWNVEGVGLVSRSNIRDLTKLINTEFEDRAQIDITMQALIARPDEIVLGGDVVRIDGEIFNNSGKIDDVTINVPQP